MGTVIFLWFVGVTCGSGTDQVTRYEQYQNQESAIEASKVVEPDCSNILYVGELTEYKDIEEPKAEEPTVE